MNYLIISRGCYGIYITVDVEGRERFRCVCQGCSLRDAIRKARIESGTVGKHFQRIGG